MIFTENDIGVIGFLNDLEHDVLHQIVEQVQGSSSRLRVLNLLSDAHIYFPREIYIIIFEFPILFLVSLVFKLLCI